MLRRSSRQRYRITLVLAGCLTVAGCSIFPEKLDLSGLAFSGIGSKPLQTEYAFSSCKQAQDFFSERKSLDPIEGVWRFGGGAPPQDPWYQVAILRNDALDTSSDDYLGVIVETSNVKFGTGDLKFKFRTDDDGAEYPGVYYMGNASNQSTSFRFVQPDLILVSLTLIAGQRQEVNVEIHRVDVETCAGHSIEQ